MNPQVSSIDERAARSATAPAATEPGARARPLLTRRSACLILLGAAGTATAVLRIRPLGREEPKAVPEAFDETYRGRRITGTRLPDTAGTAGAWQVSVDGRPLHLMRRADGSYLSMVDHYESYPTPLAAARGAVAELGGQALQSSPDRTV
ncbi:tyrosinase cofactor [Streptomyces sp. Q6]|uniref:Tyrosinase cofactor n=1 Tax=Streptomyces citrinus TaxID=3118173 RepID=A0ACD5ADB8_9ACTN